MTYKTHWDFIEIQVNEFNFENNQVSAIKLLEGPYRGVEYYYTTVKVLDDIEKGARISFSYTVHSNPLGVELYRDEKFKSIVIEILDQILTEKPGIEAVDAKEHFNIDDSEDILNSVGPFDV